MNWYCEKCKKIHTDEELCPHIKIQLKEHPEWIHRIQLYCDYDPNRPLYDILYESGIPKNKIGSICPWKTGIEIDENDNAVIIIGYQKRDYI